MNEQSDELPVGERCWLGEAPHVYCVPGCSEVAHCSQCYATMPQTPEWDEWWIDDLGTTRARLTDGKESQ